MISIILLFTAGIFNAFMDKFKTWGNSIWHNKDNWFTKWAGPDSWKRKWKLDPNGKPIKNNKTLWYYAYLYKPYNKEWFPYSSTFLVFCTDGWHFFQMLWWFSVVLAVMLYVPFFGVNMLIEFVILNLIRMISFTLFYDYILNRK